VVRLPKYYSETHHNTHTNKTKPLPRNEPLIV
jgi:hypothetical protein